jgi:hypothetical protein
MLHVLRQALGLGLVIKDTTAKLSVQLFKSECGLFGSDFSAWHG